MRFIIRGIDYDITAEQVRSCVERVPPTVRDGRNKFFISLGGDDYPIKQVISLVTSLPRIEFTAQDAYRILTKLGFQIAEYSNPPAPQSMRRLPKSVDAPQMKPVEKNGGVGSHDATSPTVDTRSFAVTFETDEDGFVVATCPTLSGCHTQGRNRDEARTNIREAIRGYTASMTKHGEEVPNLHWEVVEVVL